MAFERPFKISILHDGKKISFGPRRPNEMGRHILAVKIALGLVKSTSESGETQLAASGQDEAAPPVALDHQNWFDCGSGLGMDLRQASTYDSRLRNALVNFQIQNQFLIVSYLIEKYGLRDIIGQVKRSTEFKALGSNIPAEYNQSLLKLIESSIILFDSELGLLGEATLAVLHGWVPHTTLSSTGYTHSAHINHSTVIDIVHRGLGTYLSGFARSFGQTYQDMVRQGICVEGGMDQNNLEKLGIYLEYASDNTNWTSMVGEWNPFVTNRSELDFHFTVVEYVKKDVESSSSILYAAAIEAINNFGDENAESPYGPESQTSSEKIENLKRMYFPDPFIDPPPFEIDDQRIGFFLETEYELKADSLPLEDGETLRKLEQLAIEEIFRHYRKPDVWYINSAEAFAKDSNHLEKVRIAYFAGGMAPIPEHTGYYPFPLDVLQKLDRLYVRGQDFDPEFLKYNSYKDLKYRFDFNVEAKATANKKLLDVNPFSHRHRPAFYEATGPSKSFSMGSRAGWNEDGSREEIEEKYETAQRSIIEAKQSWPGNDKSKNNFYVLSLREDELVSQNLSQHWRAIDGIGTTEPLIKFVEYRTPSLRPQQKYRALFFINKEKLDLIENSILYPPKQVSTGSSSDSTTPQICADDNSAQTMRKYQEFKTHATKTRNEIVKKFREETKKLNYQNDYNSARADLGTHGPFDLNAAFNPFGGGMVSGTAYTEKVFSKLFGEEDSILSGIGITGTDMEQLESVMKTTDPLKTTETGIPDGTGSQLTGGDKIKISLGDLRARIKIMSEDLAEAGKEIKSGGIQFAPGSNFDAKRESNYINSFLVKLENMIAEKNSNALDRPNTELTFKFDQQIFDTAKIGPKVGKSIDALIINVPPAAQSAETDTGLPDITPSSVVSTCNDADAIAHDLIRARTINYISRIFDMTTRYLPEGSFTKSFFEDSRGSCKDLGIDIKKTLGISYIGKYTSGLKVVADEKETAFEAVRKWRDNNISDPFDDWVNASAENARASNPADPKNDFFDEKQALKMMGEMCEWTDVYKAIFDKLDIASLLCDYIKCIKLPGFDIKLPSFHLPPLPKIPIIGWMGEIYNFLLENFDKIINRLLCTVAKLIIDKLTIPFCEEQLREFISAGSSAGPLWNEALADSLLLTGFPGEKKEQAKEFFEDSASILTNEELCRILKGQSLDQATIGALLKLVSNRGLDLELQTEEDIVNFFGVLYQYLPAEICTALESPQYILKDCEDTLDAIAAIRNQLLADDPNIDEDKLNQALEIAKKNRDDIAKQMQAFSGSDIDSLAPNFFKMGDSTAIVSDYPSYLKKQLNDSMLGIFEPARSSYITTLSTFIPSMRVLSPYAPRAGQADYNDIETLQLESAMYQLAAYTYYTNRLGDALAEDQEDQQPELDQRLTDLQSDLEAEDSNIQNSIDDFGTIKTRFRRWRTQDSEFQEIQRLILSAPRDYSDDLATNPDAVREAIARLQREREDITRDLTSLKDSWLTALKKIAADYTFDDLWPLVRLPGTTSVGGGPGATPWEVTADYPALLDWTNKQWFDRATKIMAFLNNVRDGSTSTGRDVGGFLEHVTNAVDAEKAQLRASIRDVESQITELNSPPPLTADLLSTLFLVFQTSRIRDEETPPTEEVHVINGARMPVLVYNYHDVFLHYETDIEDPPPVLLPNQRRAQYLEAVPPPPASTLVEYNSYIDRLLDPKDKKSFSVRSRGYAQDGQAYISTSGVLAWTYPTVDTNDTAKRAAVIRETRDFWAEYGEEEPNSPKLTNMLASRVNFLSNQINEILQRRSTSNIELHLPYVREAFKWQSEEFLIHQTQGADRSDELELQNFVKYNKDENELKLNFQAGVYSPSVVMQEVEKGGNFDRYDITVKGDFFLNQIPEDEVTFRYCDEIPQDNVNSRLALGELAGNNFTKREAWASFLFDKMAVQFGSDKRARNLNENDKSTILTELSEKNFEQVTEKAMEQVIFSLYNSRFFDGEYAEDLDDRISGKPIYKQSCVSNRFGISEASVLAFDKVVLGDPAAEIALESMKPENSPFNRDFDTPGPFEKALKTISVKAFIRACLIEILLKGGIAYASWDIEPIISEKFFIDYVLKNIETELDNNANLKGLWRKTLERSESISSPKQALRTFVTTEMMKLPNYSKEIFNTDQPKRDFFEWEIGDILPMIDYPSHSSSENSDAGSRWKGYRASSRPPVCKKGMRSFHIEEYYTFRVPQETKDRLEELDISPWWNGSAPLNYFNNEWIEEWLADTRRTHRRIIDESGGLARFDDFVRDILSGVTAEHKVRLILIEQGSTNKSWEHSDIASDADPLQDIALKYFAPNEDPIGLYGPSTRARKGLVEVKFETEAGEYSSEWRRAVTVDLARAKRDISPSSCPVLWSLDSTSRNFKVFSGTKEEDTKRYMRKLLAETSDFQFVMNTVFPIRRFMSMASIYSTSILSGYSAVPDVMKSAKIMISTIAKIADTPRRLQDELVGLNQSAFQDYIKKNFPSDPSDPSCFEFPGLGGDFFDKFFSDLWDLFKQLPSILLRGIAFQLEPGYKEMRTHYLNCDIEKLKIEKLAGSTVDSKLVNGLRVGSGGHGNNNGKYASLYSMPIDLVHSFTNPFKMPRRLEKTILKTMSYVYSGGAPFIDLNSVFKIPCLEIDKNYLEGEKYDFGKYGRYGHPLGPFALFALMTPELNMDRKMKKGKCRPIPTIPCEDLEEETT